VAKNATFRLTISNDDGQEQEEDSGFLARAFGSGAIITAWVVVPGSG
jgi:hypothetical protein